MIRIQGTVSRPHRPQRIEAGEAGCVGMWESWEGGAADFTKARAALSLDLQAPLSQSESLNGGPDFLGISATAKNLSNSVSSFYQIPLTGFAYLPTCSSRVFDLGWFTPKKPWCARGT